MKHENIPDIALMYMGYSFWHRWSAGSAQSHCRDETKNFLKFHSAEYWDDAANCVEYFLAGEWIVIQSVPLGNDEFAFILFAGNQPRWLVVGKKEGREYFNVYSEYRPWFKFSSPEHPEKDRPHFREDSLRNFPNWQHEKSGEAKNGIWEKKYIWSPYSL
jgi:hypothetical protein